MESAEQLLESVSPNGNVVAYVEQDGDTCHLYLHGNDPERFGVKSCWVRNLRPAPAQLDVTTMREGKAPMLPREFCRHPGGAALLAAERLKIVWSEEGDAAALYDSGELLAVIPAWGGQGGFHGYARDCIQQNPLCWPLGSPDTNAQFERYRRAREYWESWSQGDGPWPAFRDRACVELERAIGKPSNYYAIDGGVWPPKALVRIPRKDDVLLLTIGMSLRPQPEVEMHYEDPAPHRRIELAMCIDRSVPDAGIIKIAAYISGQTNLPWNNHTFLGNGHTVPADVFAELSGGQLPVALLLAAPSGVPVFSFPSFRGDPITHLWLTPISQRERAFAEVHKSPELAKKLRDIGAEWRHTFKRHSVV